VSTRVRVGEVEVRVEAELTPKEIKALLRTCAGIALGLAEAAGEPERQPFGFNAHVERATGLPPEYQFTDDEDNL
jgi:hypothetical protein